MARVAVLAVSFSLREQEPNPCNVRIAEEAFRISDELIAEGHVPFLVAQWEVDLALNQLRSAVDFGNRLSESEVFGNTTIPYLGSVSQPADDSYLSTKEVYEVALPKFQEEECTHFVGVAQPFIHQPYLYWLARRDFKLLWRKTRDIGFDPESTQPWCRSRTQFARQSVRLLLGSEHGYNGRQGPQS